MNLDEDFSRALYLTQIFLPAKGSETTFGPEVQFTKEIYNISYDHLCQHIDFNEKNSRLEERLSEAKKNHSSKPAFISWAESIVSELKKVDFNQVT